jgi:hypothetical protein
MRLTNVVGATRYSFEDRESKRLVEGVNVWFMQESEGKDAVGQIPAKVSLPIDTWEDVRYLPFPIDCEAHTKEVITKRGIISKVIGLEAILK